MEEQKKVQENLSSEDKLFSVLAYFNVLCLVSALVKKDSEYVMFHVKQGIVLFVIETLCWVLMLLPLLGVFLFAFIMFICGVLSIIGMINAVIGNKWGIPLVETWAKKITIS